MSRFNLIDRAHAVTIALPPKTQSALSRASFFNAAFRSGMLLALLLCLLTLGANSAWAQSLSAPSSLVATSFSKNQINLQWNDPNPSGAGAQESGYVIERAKNSPTTFSEASVTGPNVSTWPNMSLSAGTTYYFRVRAFAVSGGTTVYSAYSPVASATTQSTQIPDAPAGLLAMVVNDTQVKLTWQNKAANATGYHVQQLINGSWPTVATAAASANYFVVGQLASRTSYTFRVTAFNASGESPASDPATATTKGSSDSLAPAGSIVINSGVSAVASSAVTLSLSATDAVGVTGYFVATTSNAPTAATAGWTPVIGTTNFAASVAYTLPAGTSTRTVYAWYKDAAGNVSSGTSASILIDQTAPGNGIVMASPVGATQVNVSWSGFSDADSGINGASYKVVSATGTAPVDCNSGTVIFSGSAASASHSGLTASTTYYYRVCVSDMVGNVSSGATGNATTSAGGVGNGQNSTGIKINSDAPYTTSLAATVNLGMTDPAGVVAYWLSSNSNPPTAGSTGWVSVAQTTIYSANVPFTLAAVDGTRTLYAWYRNASGVVSAGYSDAIFLDRVAPSNGTAGGTGSLGKVTLSWSGFTDNGSGLATTGTYTVVTATGVAPASCSAGTVLYTGTATTFDHLSATPGVMNYYRVCATDQAGNLSTGATASGMSVSNVAPVANAGPDQFGLSGTTMYFDASGSTDADGSIVSFAFSFGDGFTVNSGNSAVVGHAYSNPGTYTFSVTVTDNQGLTHSDSAVVTIRAATASTGTFTSVKQIGGQEVDVGYAVAVDAAGNTVTAGTFRGTVNFGGGNLQSAGASDVYIAKYSSSGTHICSLAVGGGGEERVNGVATDASGNIVIVGSFQGTVDFGGVIKTAAGISTSTNDGFIAKYSSNCATAAQWVRTFGSSTDDGAYGVAVDGNGDVVMTGFFTSYSDFGGGNVLGNGPYAEVVVAKYTGSNGAYQWAHVLSGVSIDQGRTLALDPAGNVIIGGSFNQTVALDSQQTPLLVSRGAADGFVAKFSPTGVLQWARSFGGNGEDIVNGITVDKGGNIAVAGSFEQTMTFTGGSSLASAGLSDGFIARFTPMGNYLWAVRIGSAEIDIGYAIAADDVGNVVVTGALQSGGQQDIFVSKYSPLGSQLWTRTYGGSTNDAGYDVALDQNGNVLVTGYFQTTANFGGTNLSSAGFSDAFLLKLTP